MRWILATFMILGLAVEAQAQYLAFPQQTFPQQTFPQQTFPGIAQQPPQYPGISPAAQREFAWADAQLHASQAQAQRNAAWQSYQWHPGDSTALRDAVRQEAAAQYWTNRASEIRRNDPWPRQGW